MLLQPGGRVCVSACALPASIAAAATAVPRYFNFMGLSIPGLALCSPSGGSTLPWAIRRKIAAGRYIEHE
jgi:hypothetical protein